MFTHLMQDCFAMIPPFPYYEGDPDEFHIVKNMVIFGISFGSNLGSNHYPTSFRINHSKNGNKSFLGFTCTDYEYHFVFQTLSRMDCALSPQNTQNFAKAVIAAGVDLFVIRGTTVSAEHVSKTKEASLFK